MFKDMIPSMVQVLEQCIKEGDDESASQIFEVFDTLLMLVKLLLLFERGKVKCNNL